MSPDAGTCWHRNIDKLIEITYSCTDNDVDIQNEITLHIKFLILSSCFFLL